MELAEVMAELEKAGSASCKRIYRDHGASEPLFGVKVGDLKKVLKQVKRERKKTGGVHELALSLWDTGNADARYLAGLMADAKRVTPHSLDGWARTADWFMLAEYAVGALAAESAHRFDCARRWIDDPSEWVADAGWSAWSGTVSITDDAELDLDEVGSLLDRVEANVHQERNRVRYTMNGFVIAVGSYVEPLRERARAVAEAVGTVRVDLGGTGCKVPVAAPYIDKVVASGRTAKRKHVRC